MAKIEIKDLRLRTIIGVHKWEREHKQDVIINIALEYDSTKASRSDNIKDAIDYKEITKSVIKTVESSKYYLLEKLAAAILNVAMKDKRVTTATVRVDKPFALRFADNVSIELCKHQ